VRVLLFTDMVSEFYLVPIGDDIPAEHGSAVVDIPEPLYQQWIATRQAYRNTDYELNRAIHRAAYPEDGT
jgi:hypothetical protein